MTDFLSLEASDLPSNWTPDPSLKDVLPPHLDYRHFRRIPEAPHRYVVNITAQHPQVWDLQDRRHLEPVPPSKKDKGTKKDRRRYRLNLGPTGGIKLVMLSRLICTAVYGAPPPGFQAHHHKDCRNDHWSNLLWRTQGANLRIERHRPRPAQKHCKGEEHPNAALSFADLFRLIQQYDHEPISTTDLGHIYGVSRVQAHRLVTGKSRTADVAKIRRMLAEGSAFRE